MFLIPFRCAPVSTIAVTLQKAATASVNVLQVVVMARFLDITTAAVIKGSFDKNAVKWFALLLMMECWKRVSYNIGRLFTNYMVIRGNENFLNECTKKRSRLEYYLLEDASTEELMNRVMDKTEQNLSEMLQRFLNFFAIYIPRITGILLIIYAQIWWLALVILVMVVPLVLVSLKGGKKIYKANEEAMAHERRHKYYFDLLSGREAVEERSLFGFTDLVNELWHRQYETARKVNVKAQALFAVNSNGTSIVTSFLSSLIVLIMVPLTASGKITFGTFVALSTAVYDLVNMMSWEMGKSVARIAQYNEFMKDLTAFAALPERRQGKEDLPEGGMELKELEFKHVTFRYPGSNVNILQDFSIKLEKGGHYAVVGENGAGKSTFIKLLTGLYQDYEGEILFNGREMKSYDAEEWRRSFSGVYQDFSRYYISVEDNIQLGNEKTMHTTEAKERMCRNTERLGIHTELSSLKYGYQTKLGKLDHDSVDLSGGQWQKVAMARALMNDAPVLILDEPTAALDPISESMLYEQFGEISRNRTTIFISHRLGSTKLSDHIFVISGGGVKEQGSHEELLQADGLYAKMFRAQQVWYTEEKGGQGR